MTISKQCPLLFAVFISPDPSQLRTSGTPSTPAPLWISLTLPRVPAEGNCRWTLGPSLAIELGEAFCRFTLLGFFFPCGVRIIRVFVFRIDGVYAIFCEIG